MTSPVHAGLLNRDQLQKHLHDKVSPDLILGERNANVPVWPVFKKPLKQGTGELIHGGKKKPELTAFIFESVDVEPVRGYSGKPITLLITLTPAGEFLDVTLLKHTEPIFGSASGFKELADFAKQYDGLTVNHDIQIYKSTSKPSRNETSASLHGILRGTVTAVAIDKSVMSAAVQVAQARLDDPTASAASFGVTQRNERYSRMGWNPLMDTGLIQVFEYSNRDLEEKFSGSAGAGRDSTAILRPDGLALHGWVAPVSLPQAGRNMLNKAGWEQVRALRNTGTQVFMVFDDSRYPIVGGQADRARLSAQLNVVQGDKTTALVPVDYSHRVRLTGRGSGVPPEAKTRFFQTEAGADFDITKPFALSLSVNRGSDAQINITQDFPIRDVAQWLPVLETPQWVKVWQQRTVDIAILVGGLFVLGTALSGQRWLVGSSGRLAWFRTAFLIFTLGFIGWYGQGQLTIVNITSLIEALITGNDASFLLADPMAVIMWGFVILSLFVWGRGTFCGWLCPFGAFQELLSKAATKLGFEQRHLRSQTDRALKWLKYVILAAIVVAAVLSGPWTERFIEVEPFKTAISMSFQRAWPYVLWAVLCLALSLVVYRGYCRYLCPLGAALALLGKVRLFSWIPRREQCGTPCQTCRYRCEYQAIEATGKVDYAECFQCLDCVSIHDDKQRCMPLIIERKRQSAGENKVQPRKVIAVVAKPVQV